MGTPTLTRPLKVGNVRTYTAEAQAVAPADAPILAPEVDADLDTLYSAWNDPASTFPPGGPAGGDLAGSSYPAPALAAGAVTTAKLADAPSGVTTAKLNDGAVTDAKIASVAYAKVAGAPASLPPSGAAGGDLAGSSYPAPAVAAGAITMAKLAPSASLVTPAPSTAEPPTSVVASSTAETLVAELTLTLTANRPVVVLGIVDCNEQVSKAGGGQADIIFRLRRGGTAGQPTGTEVMNRTKRFGAMVQYQMIAVTALLVDVYVPPTSGAVRYCLTQTPNLTAPDLNSTTSGRILGLLMA